MKFTPIGLTIYSRLWLRSNASRRADLDHELRGRSSRPWNSTLRFHAVGKRGHDLRMFFSWYGGDFTTDAALADAEPEHRANPSIASFGADYLAQQRKRLPNHKFRRLHLNLPGAPDGAAFDGDKVMAAIVMGRKRLAKEDVRGPLKAFVDMSAEV